MNTSQIPKLLQQSSIFDFIKEDPTETEKAQFLEALARKVVEARGGMSPRRRAFLRKRLGIENDGD